MLLKKYEETHSSLQEYFSKDIQSCQRVKLKKLEQTGYCKTQDYCLLNDGDLDIIINNEMLYDKIIDVAMKLISNEIEFTKEDNKVIIFTLNPNKVHGHDMISNLMLRMSILAIKEPYFKIFKYCLE